MEPLLLRKFAAFRIPGIALGVFYLLLRQFDFRFSTIGPAESAAIVILFLFIVAGVTLFVLWRFLPRKPDSQVTGQLTDRPGDAPLPTQ